MTSEHTYRYRLNYTISIFCLQFIFFYEAITKLSEHDCSINDMSSVIHVETGDGWWCW